MTNHIIPHLSRLDWQNSILPSAMPTEQSNSCHRFFCASMIWQQRNVSSRGTEETFFRGSFAMCLAYTIAWAVALIKSSFVATGIAVPA